MRIRPRAGDTHPPTQAELGLAYAAGAARGTADGVAGLELSADAIRAEAAAACSHPELAVTWKDGYIVARDAVKNPPKLPASLSTWAPSHGQR